MELNLKRPLVVFDLETTGVNVKEDRIIEISMIKIFPDGSEETRTRRINPGMPIPKSSSEVHGIYDEDVKDSPLFVNIAKSLYEWIVDCDIAGFNSNRFDVPMLVEELLRAGIEVNFNDTKFIDVQTIYHKKEKRTLEAAYKFYCDKDLVDAHSAQADTRATYEVLKSQLDKYEDLENDIDFLAKYSTHKDFVDFSGALYRDEEGVIRLGFGKHKGKSVEDVFEKDNNYFDWVQKSDFTLDTKHHFKMQYERINQEEKIKKLAKLGTLK